MLKGLLAQIADEYSMETQKANFQIDIKHEIAKILHDKYDVKMTCQPRMCGVKGNFWIYACCYYLVQVLLLLIVV